jgi:hypothetical protein
MRSVALRDYAPSERNGAAVVKDRLRIREEAVERAVARVATRFVRTWGFTTVGMVAQRFRLTTTSDEPRPVMARRALSRLRDLRWLDADHEWFTLVECDSPPSAALAKIMAVCGSVDLEDLVPALGKRHSFGDAPASVVRAYLDELVGRHERSRAWAAGPAIASALTRAEQVLVDSLRDAGGSADIAILRRDAARRSISEEILTRTLAQSPLFMRVSRGTYRVVGTGLPIEPRRLMSSARWEAALSAG